MFLPGEVADPGTKTTVCTLQKGLLPNGLLQIFAKNRRIQHGFVVSVDTGQKHDVLISQETTECVYLQLHLVGCFKRSS